MQFIKFLFLLPYLLVRKLVDRIHQDKIALYGIEGYFGLMGQGKTISVVNRLCAIRKKYGKNVYIMTNFGFTDEDFSFDNWGQLLVEYDKPIVVAWDEVQNEFSSRKFNNFPLELLTQLTQVRKNNGMLILYTAQRWERVEKVFRELTQVCWQCHTKLDRFTYAYKYLSFDYEKTINNANKYMNARPIGCVSFVQSDELRNMYDSYLMLKTARTSTRTTT